MQKTSSGLFLFGCVFLGMAVSIAFNLFFAHFYGLTPISHEAASSISVTQADQWYLRMFVLGIGNAFTFLIPAIVFWYFFEHKTWGDFSRMPLRTISSVWISLAIIVFLIPLNQRIIEWNQQIHFPGILKELESWMYIEEQEKAILTQSLLQMDSFYEILVAFAVFGLLGPIGEEVFFRGVLQSKLKDWGLSPVKSIWVAAALFSLIHFQFYGFFPRLFLGALFGYLFLWSGNLWIPIFSHIVNNGLFVLTAFSNQNWPLVDRYLKIFTGGWMWLIVSLGLSAFMLVFFRIRNYNPIRKTEFPPQKTSI